MVLAALCVFMAAEAAAFGIVYLITMGVRSKKMFSFREGLDLADMPVVTFKNNDRRINFLLDTGATNSIINSSILNNYAYLVKDGKYNIMGMEGNKREVSLIDMVLFRDTKEFEEGFQVVDMQKAFENIKHATGVTIHGILGNTFFTKYKAILDFNDCVVYFK